MVAAIMKAPIRKKTAEFPKDEKVCSIFVTPSRRGRRRTRTPANPRGIG